MSRTGPYGSRASLGHVLAVVVAACNSAAKTAPPPPKDAAIATAPSDAPRIALADASERKVFVTGAGRCGECHEKMFDEWEVSAHATAATSPLYKTAVAAANDPTCDRCHAPLEAVAPRDLTASEGVTCDVCHTLRKPVPTADGGSFDLAVDDMVKFGPRCNLKDHYFHRMGCSPEHQTAEICGSCHWWEPKGVPVFTEYADWKAGPAAKRGAPCQSCHMPDERAPLAVGSPPRDGVPHHGLLGFATELRTRVFTLEVELTAMGIEGISARIALTNTSAGHAVPAGLPERRIVVRVHVRDAHGKEIDVHTRELGRVLVDGSGAEVPFWRATKVGSDTRVKPGATWQDTITFPVETAGKVEVEVVYRGLSEAVANALGVTEIEEQKMAVASVGFGPQQARGLPRKTVVKPAAPAKRAPRKSP